MTAQNEGYKIMPPMDPKYTERSGLEGPFTTLSGKVVYYDPKEGSYYDPDTDMYMSYDEFRRYDDDYKGMKDERDDVKEVDKTSIDNAVRQALGGAPATSPRPKARPKNLPRPKPRPKMIGSNPKTGSTRGIDPRDNYSPEDLKRLLMQSAMERMNEGMMSDIHARISTADDPEQEIMDMMNDFNSPEGDIIRREYEITAGEHGLHGDDDMETIVAIMADDIGVAEGHSPHKKGTAKYKKHMAAMHAGMNEGVKRNILYREIGKRLAKGHSIDRIKKYYKDIDAKYPGHIEKIVQALKDRNEIPEASMNEGEEKPYICVHAKKGKHECRAETSYAAAKKAAAHWGLKSTAGIDAHLAIDESQVPASKPKVSVNEMQDALKLKDAPSNEHVVASYVQTMIDESHKTWDDVMEQVEFVLSLVKEGKTMEAEDVFNIVKVQHMQNYFDYKMSLKENLDTLRNIVKDKAYQTVKFEDGSMKVDLTTASMFLQVFDAQKPETQEKIQAKIKTKQGFLAMLDLIYSKM